jgi:hypothetical protein
VGVDEQPKFATVIAATPAATTIFMNLGGAMAQIRVFIGPLLINQDGSTPDHITQAAQYIFQDRS